MEPFVLINEETPYFTVPSWIKINQNLSIGFSSRKGGLSKGPFSSMNLALHVNDKYEDVIRNRKQLSSLINFSFEAWTCAEQVHYNNIEIISEEKRGKGRLKQSDAISETDGLITNKPDILLTSYYADCVPLYFFDPVKDVIGLAHAGWKGTILKIAGKMVDRFKTDFSSEIFDIRVVIGPSIGMCCYEVDSYVIEPLLSAVGVLPEDVLSNIGQERYNLDLKKLNYIILNNAGVLSENIEISSFCTSCNTELFYSYRKEQGITGRMASWIGFRKG